MGNIIQKDEHKIVYQKDDGSLITWEVNEQKELKQHTPERLKILENQISYATTLLCMEKPFFGYLLMSIIKEFSTKRPTMSVMCTGINHIMNINPFFWETLTEQQRLGLLEHELNHIAFFHTLIDIKEFPDKTARGIAVDLVVNQYIDRDRLPKEGCFIENFGLPPEKDFQYYYNELVKQKENQNKNQQQECGGQGEESGQMMQDLSELEKELEKNGDKLEGNGTFTNSKGDKMQIEMHEEYGKNSETNEILNEVQKEIVKNQVKSTMNSAAEAAELIGGNGIGNIPGHIVEILKKLNAKQPPRFNYHKFIRRFTGNCEKNFVKNTRMRPNLLIPENPGTVTRGMQNVLVGLDISGSMSTELLTSLQGDLAWLVRKGYEVTLAQFDCSLQSVEKYKKNKPLKLHGRGGTDFNSVCKYFKDNASKYSCMIVFSDGQAYAPETDAMFPNQKVLWCFTEENDEQFPGIKIHIDEHINIKE